MVKPQRKTQPESRKINTQDPFQNPVLVHLLGEDNELIVQNSDHEFNTNGEFRFYHSPISDGVQRKLIKTVIDCFEKRGFALECITKDGEIKFRLINNSDTERKDEANAVITEICDAAENSPRRGTGR